MFSISLLTITPGLKQLVHLLHATYLAPPFQSTDIFCPSTYSVVAFIMALGVLFMLHLRRNRQDAAEFQNDHHNNADYGLDDIPGDKGRMGDAYLQQPRRTQQHRMSAQQLREAQNPFGGGAELADSDKVAASHKENPPRYPDAVKM